MQAPKQLNNETSYGIEISTEASPNVQKYFLKVFLSTGGGLEERPFLSLKNLFFAPIFIGYLLAVPAL